MKIELGKVVVLVPGVINEEDLEAALQDHARGKWGPISLSHRLHNIFNGPKGGDVGSMHVDRNGIGFLIETFDGETVVCPRKL